MDVVESINPTESALNVDVKSRQSKFRIDMTDHTGVRGLLCLWMMYFHIFYMTKYAIDIQGDTNMSFFYLLGGFSSTVGYVKRFTAAFDADPDGRTSKEKVDADETTKLLSVTNNINYTGEDSSVALSSVADSVDGASSTDNSRTAGGPDPGKNGLEWKLTIDYYYARLIRVMPGYYITLSAVAPVEEFDWIKLTFNVIPICSWIGIGSINIPSWTICSLIFFWALFPTALKYCVKQTDEQLLDLIFYCFWLQIIAAIAVFFVVLLFPEEYRGSVLGMDSTAITSVFAAPYTRFPVFLMGVAAGLLCHRHPTGDLLWFTDYNWILPIGFGSRTLVSSDEFVGVVFNQSLSYIAVCIIMTTALAVVKLGYGLDINQSSRILELLISYAQVTLIVALTRADGRSVVSIFLRSWSLQQLGQLSFSVYLLHYVVISYIQFFENIEVLPMYCLLLVPAITIPLAYLMFYFVEESVRIYFK